MADRSCTHLRTGSRAFTLVEVIVVVAVILILIGLALPALSGAFAAAKTTTLTASVQQSAAVVEMYLGDSQEVYPLANVTGSVLASRRFYEPLVAAGLIQHPRELDQEGFARNGRINISMSECLVYDADKMMRGRTEPETQRHVRPVRASEVTHPASKGSIWAIEVSDGQVQGLWCCLPGAPPGPVSFCDGSVGVFRWSELLPVNEPLYTEYGIGYPVGTTWNGCRGRDRR